MHGSASFHCIRKPSFVFGSSRRSALAPCIQRSLQLPRAVAVPPAAGSRLQLNIGETSIAVPIQPEQAQQLDAAFKQLLATFAEKSKAERPRRWEMMECRFKGLPEQQTVQLMEFYCNPNAYQNAFDAKVLVTIATHDGVKITTEGRFSALRADLDGYLSQQQP